MTQETRFPYQFFVVAFAWSWLIWLPLVLAGAGAIQLDRQRLDTLTVPWISVGVFGPAVATFYCLRAAGAQGAVRDYLNGLLDLRLGWRAWVAPPVVLGVTTWLAWMLPELWGAPRVGMLLPSVWAFPPYLLLMVFLGGGQEELGWRGFILDPMEERLGPWLGNLVLGVVWATWHLPLFFIPATSQVYVPFVGFAIVMIGYSYFFSVVRRLSGNRTSAGLLAHGWGNAFVPLFPTIIMAPGAAQERYWIWAALTLCAGLGAMALYTRFGPRRFAAVVT